MSADEPEMVIPADRLPPGFAEGIEHPPVPAAPTKPAATAVLVRDSAVGPELLLMKRHRAAGFVPGAYVFPGGRVDDADGDPRLVALLEAPPPAPDASFWMAAVREVFEETGALLATVAPGERFAHWREALLTNRATLLDVLEDLGAVPDLRRVVYCAHWITPVAEPKRYDTRFFLAALPEGAEVSADAREMSDAVWVTAHAALERFRQGSLPMVFPTVKTVQRLMHYRSVDEMLAAFRGEEVEAVLPRLVRTVGGVGIVVD
jgi:recombination protein RecT